MPNAPRRAACKSLGLPELEAMATANVYAAAIKIAYKTPVPNSGSDCQIDMRVRELRLGMRNEPWSGREFRPVRQGPTARVVQRL